MIVVSKKHSIFLQNVSKWKYKVAKNGNTQVKYKHLEIVLNSST